MEQLSFNEEWQSPRAKRELARNTIRIAFECEMMEEDERLITREEAMKRLREFVKEQDG